MYIENYNSYIGLVISVLVKETLPPCFQAIFWRQKGFA